MEDESNDFVDNPKRRRKIKIDIKPYACSKGKNVASEQPEKIIDKAGELNKSNEPSKGSDKSVEPDKHDNNDNIKKDCSTKQNKSDIRNESNTKQFKPDLLKIKEDIDKTQTLLGIKVDSKCQAKGDDSLIYYAEKSKAQYAVKVMYKKPDDPSDKKKQEVLIAGNVKHKHLIRCMATSDQKNSRILVLERAVNKDMKHLHNLFYSEKLFSYLKFKKTDIEGKLVNNFMFWKSESFTRFFFTQIISGIDYLHKLNYVHGEVKLENMLLMLNFQIKITDFTNTKPVSNSKDFKTFIPPYFHSTAPECFEEKNFPCKEAYKIDVYSLGVLLYKMLYNDFFINDASNLDLKVNEENLKKLKDVLDSMKKQRSDVFYGKSRPKEFVSKELVDLIKRMCEFDIFSRVGLNEASDMPWVRKKSILIRKLYEAYENDYLKFLLELQKIDYVNFYEQKKFICCEKIDFTEEHTQIEIKSLACKFDDSQNTTSFLFKKRERSISKNLKNERTKPLFKSRIRIT